MKRYEVRIIRSNYELNGQQFQPLDPPLFTSDDFAAAKAKANDEGSAHYYGVALVDRKAERVDWGDETTPLNGVVTLGEWQGRIELW